MIEKPKPVAVLSHIDLHMLWDKNRGSVGPTIIAILILEIIAIVSSI
jgi:hypothetical protein